MVINKEAPTLYRQIAKKLLEKYPFRKITRNEARRVLGLCFKINNQFKRKVFEELEEYGLLVFVNKSEFYINYQELEEDE